jgi:hypothetical protein
MMIGNLVNLESVVVKLLLRRGLTLLGSAGAAVSDEWISQTVGLIVVAGNELLQYVLAKRAERKIKEAKAGV